MIKASAAVVLSSLKIPQGGHVEYIVGSILRIAIPVGSIIGAWYALVYFSGLPDFVIPRPGTVLTTIYVEREYFLGQLGYTLKAAIPGYILANVLGFGLASVFVAIPLSAKALMPLAVAVRNVPYVVLISIIGLALGDGYLPRALVVALASFFPVLINSFRGLQAVDPLILDRMHVLHASPWTVFCRIRVPCSLPYFVAAQEITGSAAIITTIAAEWLMASSGLGYVINRSMALYRGDEVYAVALIASLISYGVYFVVSSIGRRLRWDVSE